LGTHPVKGPVGMEKEVEKPVMELEGKLGAESVVNWHQLLSTLKQPLSQAQMLGQAQRVA